MNEPYFDDVLHEFGIDVYLNGFDDQYAWNIQLGIIYSDLDLIIDESATEASQYPGLAGINAEDFDLSTPGLIEIKGHYDGSIYDGPLFTGNNSQFLFTIYYTGTARSCSDFTFDFMRIGVSFPTIPDFHPCPGTAGNNCELDDECLVGWTLGGLILSPNGTICEEAYNGGIPNVDVFITESNDVNIFGCETTTDEYGEYECDVVEHLDYRVTPINDFEDYCGIDFLDLPILRKHILGQVSLEDLWQWFAGDMNGNGTLSTADLLEIQAVILEEPVEWLSWQFIPASTYNLTDTPDDFELSVPPYDPFIDIEDVDEDISDLDFVGVKMGDLDANCSECSSFTGGGEVWVRSASIGVDMVKEQENNFSLSFNDDIQGMEVFFLAIQCEQEPAITYIPFNNTECFTTWYHDGVYYISYVSLELEGDSFVKGEPVLKLSGYLDHASQGGKQKQNEIIYKDNYSGLNLVYHSLSLDELYPNPAHGVIYIELASTNVNKDAVINIYDMVGNSVLFKPLTSQITRLDLDLTAGSYLYMIRNRNLITNGKLIIQ